MDFREYRLLCEAHQLKTVDEELTLNKLAYLIMKASLKDKKGRPVYRKFSNMFDYEKEIGKVEKKQNSKKNQEVSPQMSAYLAYLKKKKGGDEDE